MPRCYEFPSLMKKCDLAMKKCDLAMKKCDLAQRVTCYACVACVTCEQLRTTTVTYHRSTCDASPRHMLRGTVCSVLKDSPVPGFWACLSFAGGIVTKSYLRVTAAGLTSRARIAGGQELDLAGSNVRETGNAQLSLELKFHMGLIGGNFWR